MLNKKLNLFDHKKILIIQTAFIGDVLLCFPFIDKLKSIHPNCEIDFITIPSSIDNAKSLNSIDNVIEFDKRGKQKGIQGIIDFSKQLSENNYDLIISLHKSFRSSLLSLLTRSKSKVTFKNSSLSILFQSKVKYILSKHEIFRNFEILKAFSDIEFNNEEIESSFRFEKIEDFSKEIQKKNIFIFPGSVWKTKQWLPENFHELVKKFKDQNVFLFGSPSEEDLCNSICQDTHAINLAGKYKLNEVISLIKNNSDLVICNDSSPTHMAHIAEKDVITIYGPTSPIFGFYPINGVSIHKDLDCSPCEIHGSNECPIKTHKCMKDISPEEVYLNAIDLLHGQQEQEKMDN